MIGLNVRVGQEMGFQVGPLVEAPIADGTLVRGLLHVQDLVDGQGARLTESFATFQALEGLLFRVDVPVRGRKENRKMNKNPNVTCCHVLCG